jgi:phosphoglycolate phosphatase-like HAD superfamily hydrolase
MDRTAAPAIDADAFDAVIFDMDGVITDTALFHRRLGGEVAYQPEQRWRFRPPQRS